MSNNKTNNHFYGWRFEETEKHRWKITGHVNPALAVPSELSMTFDTKDDMYHAIFKYRGEAR